jgi:tetratricopeptide (TPR) repeat protein
MCYADVLTHPLRFDQLSPGESMKISFGTNEQGGFAFNFIGGSYDGFGPAMYFLQGNFGILFVPRDNGALYPKLYSKLSPLDFSEEIETEFGIDRRSMFTHSGHYAKKGEACLKRNDFIKAVEYFNKTLEGKNIEKEPYYAQVLFFRALAYGNLGDFEKAIDDLTIAIETDDKRFDFYQLRGVGYEIIGQIDKAIEDFSEALNLNPSDSLSLKHLLDLNKRNKAHE